LLYRLRPRAVFPTPLEAKGALFLLEKRNMAEPKKLAATVRGGIGKGAARATRREGRTPAVIYGGGEAPTPLSLDSRAVSKLIFSGHFLTTIFELDIDGRVERAIPRDYQLDVVKDFPLHVDFLRLKPGSRLRIEVPVHFVNHEAAPGLKRGGSINVVYHSVEMWVPADNIPDAITADLTGFDFNDSLHISAIPLPPGCKPTNPDKNFTVASITPPAVVEEQAATAAAAPAKGGKAGKAAPAKK
jgi:large subunit ribosomal protein L25